MYSRKHILNKNLKPIELDDGLTLLYPVYIQVIYRRKNYMFKSMITTYYADLDDINPKDRGKMEIELELLSAILDYEIKAKGMKFDVAGFSNKYNHYRRSIVEEAERSLLGNIEHIIRSRGSKYQGIFNYKYEQGKVALLIEIIEVLMPELIEDREFLKCRTALIFWEEYIKTFPEKVSFGIVFPTVFDWISGDHMFVLKNIFTYKDIGNTDLLIEYGKEFDLFIKEVTINR